MTGRPAAFALAGLAALATAATAAPASLALPPGATETTHTHSDFAALRLPVGRWDGSRLPLLDLRGQVDQTAWRLESHPANTLALIAGLADQLAAEGFKPIFACATDDCGGFDFRYAAPILPEPEMHVDLGDFQYQLMIRGRGDQADYAALITSRSGDTVFAQLTAIGQAQPLPLPAPAPAVIAAPPPEAPPPLADRLQADGHVVLDDLSFASGSADLAPGSSASLAAIAAYLAAHPDARITIVGHTDASGAQSANLDLSRARAASVVARLIADYGVAPAQLSSDGIGALSPLTTNLTDAGRQKNRRVEAVLTSTR